MPTFYFTRPTFDETDGFLLAGGLTFGQLDFVANGSDTEIQIDATDGVLAIVEDVLPGVFEDTDFNPLL